MVMVHLLPSNLREKGKSLMDHLVPQAICHYPFGQVICGWLF